MNRGVRGLTVTTGFLALLGLGSPAFAGLVSEAEVNGTAVNNTLATAQAIPSSAFTTPVPATVFNPPGFPTATISGAGGETDVDFYSFTAPGGSLLLDIDNAPFTFDTIVSLFNSAGTLIALDDDSDPADPGSADGRDSFIGTFTLPGPGTYYVAVSQFANFPTGFDCDEVPLTRPDGGPGGSSLTGCAVGDATFPNSGLQEGADYTLHISLSASAAAVPMPATLALLVSAGAGLGAVRAWRRR